MKYLLLLLMLLPAPALAIKVFHYGDKVRVIEESEKFYYSSRGTVIRESEVSTCAGGVQYDVLFVAAPGMTSEGWFCADSLKLDTEKK